MRYKTAKKATFLVALVVILTATLGVSQVWAQGPIGEQIAQEAVKLVGKYPYMTNTSDCDQNPCTGFYVCTDVVTVATYRAGVPIAKDPCACTLMRQADDQVAFFKGQKVQGANNELARHFEPSGSVWSPEVGNILLWSDHVAVVVEAKTVNDRIDLKTVETTGGTGKASIGYRQYQLTRKGGWYFNKGNRHTLIQGWGVIDEGSPLAGLVPLLLPGLAEIKGKVGWTKLVPLFGLTAFAAVILVWFVRATEEKKRKLVLRVLRSIPVLVWCFEKAGLMFLEFCLLTTVLAIALRPLAWPTVVYQALRVPVWKWLLVAGAFLLAYILLKRGPFSKLKVVLLTAPWLTMAVIVWRVGALPAIDFSQKPINPLSGTSPAFPPMEMVWWNGDRFTLDVPPEIWQDIWDAGKWGAADPSYLVCLGTSESTKFWTNVGPNSCSGADACGPDQFLSGTWQRYSPWPGASRYNWPDAEYGKSRMVADLKFDQQTTQVAHQARFTGVDGGACWNRHAGQANFVWRCTQAVRNEVGKTYSPR